MATKDDSSTSRLLAATEEKENDTATSTAAAGRHKHWRCNFDMASVKESNPMLKKNSQFVNHVYLSLSVALYVTLLALPVYSTKVNVLMFGHDRTPDGAELCGSRRIGLQVNTGTDASPKLVPFMSTSKDGEEISADDVRWKDVYWCGFLPSSYVSWWPSGVQMMLFTVYKNTGSTVQLAWQSIAGSTVAVANIWLLTLLYPNGTEEPTYNPVVVWADLVIITFLLLASGCNSNTKKFGLSWTMYFVMKFMSPAGIDYGVYTIKGGLTWDGEPTCVMLTSVIGCLVGVLATVFPLPLTNINLLRLDSDKIVNELQHLFEEAIVYYAGGEKTPRVFQIYAKIDALQSSISQVSTNLADSYWETFNLGSYSRIRELYQSFNNAAKASDDEMFVLKSSLSQLEFNEQQKAFAEVLAEPLKHLVKVTSECLRVCCAVCSDGNVLPEDRVTIGESVEKIKKAQEDLSHKFTDQCDQRGIYASTTIAADALFVFSVAHWSREMMDWAGDLATYNLTVSAKHNPLHILLNQTRLIFNPYSMFSKKNLQFALANGTPILITYAIARFMSGGVLVQYDSTMPGTLSILISQDVGSGALQNIQRLTALVFGHTLPMLAMVGLRIVPCDWLLRPVAHAFVLMFFMAFFFYMYCASQRWSLIGLIVAAFACFPLFHTCDEHAKVGYSYHYKVIAEVILAILVKMAVQPLFAPKTSRDMAMDKVKELFAEVHNCYEKFFLGHFEEKDGFRSKIKVVKQLLAECEELSPMVDPAVELVGWVRLPFKKGLYDSSLKQIRLVTSDLDTIASAIGGYVEENHLPGSTDNLDPEANDRKAIMRSEKALWTLLTSQPSWTLVKDDLKDTLKITLNAVTAVLEHATEEKLDSKDTDSLKHVAGLSKLDGIHELYQEMSKSVGADAKDAWRSSLVRRIEDTSARPIITDLKRTRATVINHAFSSTVQHLVVIASACFEYMPYL